VKLIEKIRCYFGFKALKHYLELNPRKIKVCNLQDAKSIGILFSLYDQESFKNALSLEKQIKNSGKKISLMCFSAFKVLPEFYTPKADSECFTLRDIDWKKMPFGGTVERFASQEFDILIVPEILESLPVMYLAAISKARFKTGKTSEHGTAIYDLNIQLPVEGSQEELIRNIVYYLSLISNGKSES
jgi:hypothetical protein